MKIENNKEQVIECLNRILEHELAGVVRYSHYSLMVFGYNRIPICGWLREQSRESLTHAEQVGEKITAIGGHPSLRIGKLLETHQHSIQSILEESLEHERYQVKTYEELLKLVENTGDVFLEEFARQMIYEEKEHIADVEKMLRAPQ